jgi:ADP-ribose pyrophosphatase YjhB (NUDIX family)
VEAALVRELREELGAEVEALQQVLLVSVPVGVSEVEVQHCFVCRLRRMEVVRRTGPEFNDSARGYYLVDRVALTGDDLGGLGLKPDELRAFIQANRAAIVDAVAVHVE